MTRMITSLIVLATLGCGGQDRHNRHGGDKRGQDDGVSDWRVLVETVQAESGTVAKELVTHGTLESEAMADITPEAGGVVTEILVEEGDTVRRGQVLAVLSNPSLEAGSDRARIELAQGRRRFEQAQNLHTQGAISDTEFQDAKDAYSIAQASHREARGSARFTRLTSPVDGTVAIRNVRIGELAGGAERAFQVVDLDRLRVIVNLSEGDLTHMGIGQHVTLAGTYDHSARAGGAVLRISPVVDETSGTVRVTIAVDPVEGQTSKLRPGQFVEVRIEVDRHSDVLTIPRKAVHWQDGAPIAWKVVDKVETEDDKKDKKDKDKGDAEDGNFFTNLFSGDKDEDGDKADPWEGVPRRMVKRVNLKLGYSDADKAEVSEGLMEGEHVVIVGGDNLRPDADVKLPGDPKPKKKAKEGEPDTKDGEQG
jgi:membrane fusion protein (multidrug efflux system)